MTNAYDSKSEFITDFVKLCRICKERDTGGTFSVTINDNNQGKSEDWQFVIYPTVGRYVVTSATLFTDNKTISYPKTAWGDMGRRWDEELREFLRREVLKV